MISDDPSRAPHPCRPGCNSTGKFDPDIARSCEARAFLPVVHQICQDDDIGQFGISWLMACHGAVNCLLAVHLTVEKLLEHWPDRVLRSTSVPSCLCRSAVDKTPRFQIEVDMLVGCRASRGNGTTICSSTSSQSLISSGFRLMYVAP